MYSWTQESVQNFILLRCKDGKVLIRTDEISEIEELDEEESTKVILKNGGQYTFDLPFDTFIKEIGIKDK